MRAADDEAPRPPHPSPEPDSAADSDETPESFTLDELRAAEPAPVAPRAMGCLPILLILAGVLVVAPLILLAVAAAYAFAEVAVCLGAMLLIAVSLLEFVRRMWLRKWLRAARLRKIEQKRLLREASERRRL